MTDQKWLEKIATFLVYFLATHEGILISYKYFLFVLLDNNLFQRKFCNFTMCKRAYKSDADVRSLSKHI